MATDRCLVLAILTAGVAGSYSRCDPPVSECVDWAEEALDEIERRLAVQETTSDGSGE